MDAFQLGNLKNNFTLIQFNICLRLDNFINRVNLLLIENLWMKTEITLWMYWFINLLNTLIVFITYIVKRLQSLTCTEYTEYNAKYLGIA